jgi:hypothetical protein
MITMSMDQLLDAFEHQYEYKNPSNSELVPFRALTAGKGEVYIEYTCTMTMRQVNVWIDMNDPYLFKRVIDVEDITHERSEVW